MSENWRCGCGELNNSYRKVCGYCGTDISFPYDPIWQSNKYKELNKMTNQFVIKIGEWYYNKYPDMNLVPESFYATKFAHPENARQEITEKKLKDAKVMQINLIENEVK